MTRRSLRHGQAMTEFLVIAAAMVIVFFVVELNGRTLSQYCADVIRLFYRNLTYFISLP
jgi:hypothetical protein